MGADAGDYDGDGQVDFTLTAFAHDRNTIYRGVGSGSFEDATQRPAWRRSRSRAWAGGSRSSTPISTGGSISSSPTAISSPTSIASLRSPRPTRKRSQLLLNQGGTFRDVSAGTGRGLQTPRVSRGLAVGDLDNDGDPDVVLSNMDAPPALLENRQRTGRHWIAFQFTAPAGNRLAIGATVTITAGGRRSARGALRRQLSVAVGSAAAVRARRRSGSGVGRGSDARRCPLVVAGSARWTACTRSS